MLRAMLGDYIFGPLWAAQVTLDHFGWPWNTSCYFALKIWSPNAALKILLATSFRHPVHYNVDILLQWNEEKFTIWDNSFENELNNDSGTAQVGSLKLVS